METGGGGFPPPDVAVSILCIVAGLTKILEQWQTQGFADRCRCGHGWQRWWHAEADATAEDPEPSEAKRTRQRRRWGSHKRVSWKSPAEEVPPGCEAGVTGKPGLVWRAGSYVGQSCSQAAAAHCQSAEEAGSS